MIYPVFWRGAFRLPPGSSKINALSIGMVLCWRFGLKRLFRLLFSRLYLKRTANGRPYEKSD